MDVLPAQADGNVRYAQTPTLSAICVKIGRHLSHPLINTKQNKRVNDVQIDPCIQADTVLYASGIELGYERLALLARVQTIVF